MNTAFRKLGACMFTDNLEFVFGKYSKENNGPGKNQVDVAFVDFCEKFLLGNIGRNQLRIDIGKLYSIENYKNIIFGEDGKNGFHKKKGGYCYRNFKLYVNKKKILPLIPFSKRMKDNLYDQKSSKEQPKSFLDDNFAETVNNLLRLYNLIYVFFITYEATKSDSREDLNYLASDTYILHRLYSELPEKHFVHTLANLNYEYCTNFQDEYKKEVKSVAIASNNIENEYFQRLAINLNELMSSYSSLEDFVVDYGIDLLPDSKLDVIKRIVEEKNMMTIEFSFNQVRSKFPIQKFVHENNLKELFGKPVDDLLNLLKVSFGIDLSSGLENHSKYCDLTRDTIVEKILIGALTFSLTAQERTYFKANNEQVVLYKIFKGLKSVFSIQSAVDSSNHYSFIDKDPLKNNYEREKNEKLFLQIYFSDYKSYIDCKEKYESFFEEVYFEKFKKILIAEKLIKADDKIRLYEIDRFSWIYRDEKFLEYMDKLLCFLKSQMSNIEREPELYYISILKSLEVFQTTYWTIYFRNLENSLELKHFFFNYLFVLNLLLRKLSDEYDFKILKSFFRMLFLNSTNVGTAELWTSIIMGDNFEVLLSISRKIVKQNNVTYGY